MVRYMPQDLKIAVAHMKTRMLSRRFNNEKMSIAVSEAKRKRASLLIVSPLLSVEDIVDYYPQTRLKAVLKSYAERMPTPALDNIITKAIEENLYISIGGLLERAGPKLFMIGLVVTPNGRIEAKYRKIMISLKEAGVGISPGRSIALARINGIKVGLLLDDDIVAPELSRHLKLMGAKMIIYMLRKKNFNSMVLRSLAIARAVETELPVVVCGSIVEWHGEVLYSVPSMIIDHNGQILCEAHSEERVIVGSVRVPSRDNMRYATSSYKILSETCRELSKSYKLS